MTLISRRTMLAGSGAAAAVMLAPRAPLFAQGMPIVLKPAPGFTSIMGVDGPRTPILGYGGRVPGPPIVVRQGGEVHARLENTLDEPTAIHWHGVRLANAMDGVPGLTQKPVAPGESFDYRFTPPDAGSFLYYPLTSPSEQVGRGLYGPLIVQEKDEPFADQDLIVLLDDWRLSEDGTIEETFGHLHDASQGGRRGNWLTVNGSGRFDIRTRSKERVRVRLFNAANARTMAMRFSGHDPVLIALDGQPVAPVPVSNATVALAPGQRAEIFIDMKHLPGKAAPIVVVQDEKEVNIGRIAYHAYDIAHEDPLPEVARLPANLSARIDLEAAKRAEIDIHGGSGGRLEGGGTYKGKSYDAAGLVEQGQVWTMNGAAGLADAPLISVNKGDSAVILFRNGTKWPHPMRIHGHHVRTVNTDGTLDPAWRDTVVVEPESERAVAFVADNPGKWLVRCQVMEHFAAGMAAWISVKP